MSNGKVCTVTASGITVCTSPLESLEQTIDTMLDMSKRYKDDIPQELRGMTPVEFYLHLRDNVPYRKDPEGWETISRPKISLDPAWQGPIDCDDKTVAACAWLGVHDIPWSIRVIGQDLPTTKGVVWHVFPMCRDTVFDATYPGRSQIGKLLYKPTIDKRYYPKQRRGKR